MSDPFMGTELRERYALRCHQSNVARWRFYQLPEKEVTRCLKLAEKANDVHRAHKRACKEKIECGWGEKIVTPWIRDENQYILVPVHLLATTGCIDEAEKTWLADIRARTMRAGIKNWKNRTPVPVVQDVEAVA